VPSEPTRGGGIRHPRRPVVTRCNDAPAIAREHCANNSLGVALQNGEQLAARGIPHSRCVVVTGGNDALAVGRELRASNHAGVALQGGQQLAGGAVPSGSPIENQGYDQIPHGTIFNHTGSSEKRRNPRE